MKKNIFIYLIKNMSKVYSILNIIYDLLKSELDINIKRKRSPLLHIIIKNKYPYTNDYQIFFEFFETLNFDFNAIDKNSFFNIIFIIN